MPEEPKKITMADLQPTTEEPRVTSYDLRRASMEAKRKAEEGTKKTKPRPDQFRLLDLYVDKGSTLREIAEMFDVSHVMVRTWLLEAEIPLRSVGPRAASGDYLPIQNLEKLTG